MSEQGSESFGSASIHAGQGAWACCAVFDDGRKPHLSVNARAVHITVYLAGDVITADHVRFADELAEAARQLSAECKRLHAWQRASANDGDRAA